MLQHTKIIPFPGAERSIERELERLHTTLTHVQQAFQQNVALLLQVQREIAHLKAIRIGPLIEVLTPREVDIIRLVASGLTNRQIGQRLSITEDTVKRHMSNILAKLNATGRAEGAAKARLLGLI